MCSRWNNSKRDQHIIHLSPFNSHLYFSTKTSYEVHLKKAGLHLSCHESALAITYSSGSQGGHGHSPRGAQAHGGGGWL